ncbi:MAG: SUMF1/EgtB/PvdO family nonheme iron enzyme [Candidatus Alcyoniella australis]|nr:SUMF1/EgtB/PvdO family nonheme iron enzyme [Candidatus Alcyoniella australis]
MKRSRLALTLIVFAALMLCFACGKDRSQYQTLDPLLAASIERAVATGPLLIHPELIQRLGEHHDFVRFALFSEPGDGLPRPVIDYKHALLRPGVDADSLLGCPSGMWTAQDAGEGYVLLTNHYGKNRFRWLASQGSMVTPQSDRLPIPGGTFTAGGSKDLDQLGGLTTYIAMPVELEPFQIGRLETTNGQFAAFLNQLTEARQIDKLYDLNNPAAKIVFEGEQYRVLLGCEDYPVTCVTWHGADAFCRAAGGALPTNVQWELAARGYERRLYPWGDSFERQRTNIYGDEDGYDWLAPADSMPQGASALGTLHQAGNVYEWVAHPDRPPANGPVIGCDLRGGAWDTMDFTSRSDAVDNNRFDAANQHNGFRCAW